jgi:hypothetical protein
MLPRPEDESTWVKNCGRGVHHHLSWLPIMQNLDVIRKQEDGRLCLGALQNRFSFTGDLEKLRIFIEALCAGLSCHVNELLKLSFPVRLGAIVLNQT